MSEKFNFNPLEKKLPEEIKKEAEVEEQLEEQKTERAEEVKTAKDKIQEEIEVGSAGPETEKSNRYEDDPIVKETIGEINRLTTEDMEKQRKGGFGKIAKEDLEGSAVLAWDKTFNRISMHKWNDFIRKYPDKANVYRNKNEWINRVLQHIEMKEAEEQSEKQSEEQE